MTGKIIKAKGQVEKVVGVIAGNKDLESKGEVDRRVGVAKEKIGRIKGKVEAVTDKLEKEAEKVIDRSARAARRK
jgi:uncharacterized protein YjbJ (UPF0337 family)